MSHRRSFCRRYFQVLQNIDELFDREELSAAPDAGWPDCFNSGVFVYVPSEETYQTLLQFAVTCGSFDGGYNKGKMKDLEPCDSFTLVFFPVIDSHAKNLGSFPPKFSSFTLLSNFLYFFLSHTRWRSRPAQYVLQ